MAANEGGPTVVAREQPQHEVADVFRLYGNAYRQAHRLPTSALRIMHAIETCRTALLGGHLERCTECGFERPAYNSCLMVSAPFWGAPPVSHDWSRAIRSN